MEGISVVVFAASALIGAALLALGAAALINWWMAAAQALAS